MPQQLHQLALLQLRLQLVGLHQPLDGEAVLESRQINIRSMALCI